MKQLAKLLLLQLGLFTSCVDSKRTDDPEKLKAVLTGYFDGIKTKDFEKMKSLTTRDFILYEDGKVFNNDSLINLIKTFNKFTARYSFDNVRINVDTRIGNMSYLNHGEFVFNDTAHVTFNWLESAAFQKIGDDWKLQFLHSTIRK
jgi:hypothetical protein